ncbi:MAG: hypothetical protein ACJ76N_22795 [Thermoanaerobaculia bacterium]
MRLADKGEVYGHFVIPYVDDLRTRDALLKAVTNSKGRLGILRTEFTSIAGECDLLLHLYLSDFRVVADLQAEVTDSYSLATSWLYAIPYENPGSEALPDGDLEFFIYLRVHRHYYACYGTSGESALQETVQRLLQETGGEQLSGRVLYSLGWPDLIVHGRVTGDIQHLRHLIVALQLLSFPTAPAEGSERLEGESPIFLRTITVIGTPMALSGSHGSPHTSGQGTTLPVPIVFGRNRPGMTVEAIVALRSIFEQFGANTVSSWAVNGTWDFVVTSPQEEPVSLQLFHEMFRQSREGFARHGIERTQTHLLTSREADLEMLRHPLIVLRPQAEREPLESHCACGREDFEWLRDLLERAERIGHLPRGLTRTISHVLSMFRHTVREPSNCCDSIGALRAHAQGLQVLLNMSLRENELLERLSGASPDSQARIATQISYINLHLAEWCKRAGRVVREKTAGSAARLFLQIDSIVAQRGGIPKILMIAERIMEDFYAGLPRFPKGRPWRPALPGKRSFAAILEPLGNVTSQPLMGLVSIPIRYAFALHLVVPQLWHEVGQYVFWAEYSPAQRQRVDWELSRGSGSPDIAPSQSMAEAFEIDFQLRADMFADLLVFCFGFGGSLERFFLYLGSLTANVAKHDSLHEQIWNRQAVALVHRLCFVWHFFALHRRTKEEAPATQKEFAQICKKVRKALFGTTLNAEGLARRVVDHLQQEVSVRKGWPKDFLIPTDLVETVRDNLRGETYGLCLRDLEELAYAFRNLTLDGKTARLDPTAWERIKAGELVDLPSGEALQAAYRDFYLEELEAQLAGSDRPPRDGQFRKMATLGRSALLHIYQSEAGTA